MVSNAFRLPALVRALCLCALFFGGVNSASAQDTLAENNDGKPLPAPSFEVSAPDLSALEKLRATTRPVSPQLREIDPADVKDPVGAIDANTASRISRFAAETGLDASVLTDTMRTDPVVEPSPSTGAATSDKPVAN